MCSFTYEEQGNKRFLVYEKQADDRMDRTALEMISINRIEGVAASSHVQIDDCFYMKYDITGLESLCEYFRKPVNRKKFFTIFESILDTAMLAQEYMINLSSYVWNLDYMYVDPSSMKVYIVVLPIVRSEVSIEKFLKQLIFEVQYDPAEDCSYVAKLSNLLGSLNPFSISALKGRLAQIKNEKFLQKPEQIRQTVSAVKPQETGNPSKKQTQGTPAQSGDRGRLNIFKRGKDLAPEKKQFLDIIYSDEEEAQAKEKRKPLFPKKDNAEKAEKAEKAKKKKEEKKGFWGKWKKEPGTIPEMEAILEGIRDNQSMEKDYPEQNIAIPVQKVEMNRVPAEIQDGGETVYMDAEEEDDTVLIGMENSAPEPEYILTRISTNECFKIIGTGVRIGRSPSTTEICIAGNKCVGRVHAILYVQDGEVFITDNHSKNKTFVDGTLLRPEDPPCRLISGSRIRLGDEELEFRIQE
jgi:hypothetical protein